MITAAIKYATIPLPVHANRISKSRIMVGSTPKYSPTPPHTPHIMRFVLERYNLLVSIMMFLLPFHMSGSIKIYYRGSRAAVYLDQPSRMIINFLSGSES